MLTWMEVAKRELGVRELSGPSATPRILQYLATCTALPVSLKSADETSWCAAFVGWCLEQAGYESLKTAWAEAYLHYGKKSTGLYGDLVIFKNHIGFVVTLERLEVFCLGGNQDNAVSIKRFPSSKILGFVRPHKESDNERPFNLPSGAPNLDPLSLGSPVTGCSRGVHCYP